MSTISHLVNYDVSQAKTTLYCKVKNVPSTCWQYVSNATNACL